MSRPVRFQPKTRSRLMSGTNRYSWPPLLAWPQPPVGRLMLSAPSGSGIVGKQRLPDEIVRIVIARRRNGIEYQDAVVDRVGDH